MQPGGRKGSTTKVAPRQTYKAGSGPNTAALRLQNYSLKACHIPATVSHKAAKARACQ